jgi:hypothetical protein
MKAEFKGEAKIIPKVNEFHKLANLVAQRFDELGLAVRYSGDKIEELVKFTYNDSDSDVISISTDADLEEALDQVPYGQTLKILIGLKKPLPII